MTSTELAIKKPPSFPAGKGLNNHLHIADTTSGFFLAQIPAAVPLVWANKWNQ